MTSESSADSDPRPDVLAVATLAKLHGIRGEIKLRATDEYVALLRTAAAEAYPITLRIPDTGDEYEVTFAHVRGADSSPIVQIDGVDRREDAETYVGAEVCLPRDLIPAPDDDEYFLVDLERCEVFDSVTGHLLGKVTKAEALPANTVLTIKLVDGTTIYAPLANDAVPRVDIAAHRIEVDSDFLGIEDPAS